MVVCMTVRKLFLKWKLDLALKFHGSARVPLSSLSTLSLSGLCPHPRMPPLCYLFSNTSHGQNAILIFSLQILPNSLNLIFHQTPFTQTPHLLRLPSVVNAATSRGKSSLVIIFPLSYLHAKITLIYLLLSNSAFKAPTLKSKPPCSLAGIPSGIFCLESLLLSCCSLCQSSHSSQKETVFKRFKKIYESFLKSLLNLVQRCFYLMFWLFSWELCEILAPCVLCCAQSLSHVQLFATQWVVARRLSVHGILQVSSWSGLPFPPPGDLPNPGTDPESPVSPTLAEGFFFFFYHWVTWEDF